MYKPLIFLALLCSVKSEEARAHKYVDPFAALERHLSHRLAYHYFWPWTPLFEAAAALDAVESLEEPQIISEPDRFLVKLNVKRFKPDELRIKVKNRYIIVEGKHKEKSNDQRLMANHFVQRFVLPAGSKSEEVTAVLKQNGVLSISAPRHKLPPPPPDRDVPIQVITSEESGENNDKDETKKPEENRVEKEPTTVKDASIATTSASPIEQLDLVEATTHVGKIRKKELKTATKESKVNEVTKGGENNGLDYALIEPEE